jgi:hypothetical protein
LLDVQQSTSVITAFHSESQTLEDERTIMSYGSTTNAGATAAGSTKPAVPAEIAQKAEYWASEVKKTTRAWESSSSAATAGSTSGSGGDPCAFISKVFTAATQVATGNFVGAGKTLLG